MSDLVGFTNLSRQIADPDMIEGGLRSKQFATVIHLLGSGEIDSIFDEGGSGTNTFRKNIFLNNTPLQNANGDENFQDVEVFIKNGASDQTALKEIASIQNTVPIGVQVTNAASVSRATSATAFDRLKVSLQFPSLQEFKDDGDIIGAEVKISIRITENDGTVHNPIVEDIINGKASSPYVKDYEIKFADTSQISYPLTITVIRNTEDGTDTKLQNTSNFLSFTEIITDNRAYQGFAYVAIRFNAQEFQSFPTVKFRVKGTKIKIPHNATVRSDGSLSYSGDFNGTFKTNKEWSSDPAWILYDLLTTDKGFGGSDGLIEEDSLDVFSFFSASQYASEQITDPITDTTEARFSTNIILNQRNDAFNLINDLCSVMNAMPFYGVGTLQISQDRPTDSSTNTSDPQYVFTNANVTANGFTYQGSGQRTKFTEVEVSYFDNDTQQINYELITTDQITALSDAVSKFGRTRKTIKSFACTSRGQANRLGRWFLYSNLKECEVVNFTTTLEAGVIVRPSTIIGIADSMRAGTRKGGRITTGVSTTEIIVDARTIDGNDLTHESGSTLTVILPNGKASLPRTISSINGTTITVSSAFEDDEGNTATPQSNSIYVIESPSVQLQTYRVLSVTEQNKFKYGIVATIHDTNKYAQVEDTTVAADPRVITTLIDEKPSPSNLSAVEQIVVLNNRAVSKIFVSWQPVLGVKEYLVEFQFEKDNPERLRVSRPSFELFESRLGSYKFKVKSYNALGVLSSTTSSIDNFTAVGKTAVPNDVQNVQIEPLSDQFVRLRFDKSTDVDVIHGGNVVIRSSNLTTGATFTNAIDVLPELSGNISESIVPNIVNGTYLLAFRDDGGRLSANPASIKNINTEPDVFPKLTILIEREDLDSPPFQGVRDDCFFSDEVNGLVLGSTVTLDDEPDFDAIADFDFIGDVDFLTGGQYFFANTLDLGGKQPLKLRRHFVTQGFLPNDLIDKRTANVDSWTDFDGATAFNVNATLSVATTDSDPDLSVSATYTINDGSGGAGTTITITKSSHGYSVGSLVTLDFTSGTGVDGDYLIASVPDANTFLLNSATSLNTSGNCNYSAEFEPYQKFVNGTYTARGFKFKCDLLSTDPAQSIEIDQLGYFAELVSRTETSLGNAAASSGGFIASGTSTKSITFTNSFFTGQGGTSVGVNSVLPSIGITIENAQSGDFFTLSNITGTGFDIDIKNGGSNVDRNFKYAATGFGRGS